jgi:hypothetical protein
MINYTFPGGLKFELYAVVDPNITLNEITRSDNTAHVPAFAPDLAILSTSLQYWGGNQYGMAAQISNLGVSASEATVLTFAFENAPSVALVSANIAALNPGEKMDLNLSWTSGVMVQGSYPLVAQVTVPASGDANPSNNSEQLALEVRSDLVVSPYALWVTDWKTQSKEVTINIVNSGAVEASNVKVNLYNSPQIGPSSLVGTQTIPTVLAGNQAVLKVNVNDPLTNGLYVLVDPDNLLMETQRSNNMAMIVDPSTGTLRYMYIPSAKK